MSTHKGKFKERAVVVFMRISRPARNFRRIRAENWDTYTKRIWRHSFSGGHKVEIMRLSFVSKASAAWQRADETQVFKACVAGPFHGQRQSAFSAATSSQSGQRRYCPTANWPSATNLGRLCLIFQNAAAMYRAGSGVGDRQVAAGSHAGNEVFFLRILINNKTHLKSALAGLALPQAGFVRI